MKLVWETSHAIYDHSFSERAIIGWYQFFAEKGAFLKIMQDWAGWLPLFSSFFIVMSFREVRKDRSVAFALFFILALHHIVAIANAYIVSLPGIGDSYGFVSKATISADLGEIASGIYYIKILSVIYMILGSSHFLGEELSVLAFAFSCIVFIKILNIINVRRHRVWLLMLYGLLPGIMLFTSVALREAYQILFLMLIVYCGLRVHLNPMNGARLLMILSALLIGLFHHALILIAAVLVPVLLLWKPHKSSIKRRFAFSKRRFVNVTLVIIFIVGGYYLTGSSVLNKHYGINLSLSIRDSKETIEMIEHRTGILKNVPGRTNYDSKMDFSSVNSTVRTTLRSLVYYLFSPFSWQIRTLADIIPGFEALIRFLLIGFSIKSWYKAQGSERRLYGLLLLVYFLVTIFFAFGTGNYGTAMRHNVVSYWLIVLVGGSGLIKFVTKFILPISKSEVHNSSCEINGY